MMTEQVMTAQELAEARELEQAATFGNRTISELDRYLDDVADDGVSPDHDMTAWDAYHVIEDLLAEVKAARTLVPRLLVTVDALTERAERAEAELGLANTSYSVERERVADLTRAKERAEGERDAAEKAVSRALGWLDDSGKYGAVLRNLEHGIGLLAKERDEALALADARGRALTEILQIADDTSIGGLVRATKMALTADRALKLPAPEALRQQQEREASLLAHMETLRQALENERDFLNDCASDAEDDKLFGFSDAAKDIIEALESTPLASLVKQREREAEKDALIERLRGALFEIQAELSGRTELAYGPRIERAFDAANQAYNLTPPQALAQQREYVGALEAVAEAARLPRHPERLAALAMALANLDSLKK